MCGPNASGNPFSQEGNCHIDYSAFPRGAYFNGYDGGGGDYYSLPDENSEGGGDFIGGGICDFHGNCSPSAGKSSYAKDFDNIRSWIERMVDRWRDLPKDIKIYELWTDFNEVVESLADKSRKDKNGDYESPNKADVDSDICWPDTGKGSLMPNIGRITDDLNTKELLDSSAVGIFQKYVQDLWNALAACQGIAAAILGAIDSERHLWLHTRMDATQTIHTIAGVCDRLAANGSDESIDPSEVLSVFSLDLGAVALIPGPQQIPLSIVALAMSVATMSIGASKPFEPIDYTRPERPHIPNYDEAIKTLSLLLNGSGSGVSYNANKSETSIRDSIDTSIDAIDTDKGNVLNPAPGPITEATPGTLKYDQGTADGIVQRMGWLADELSAISGRISTCLDRASDALRRDDRIGIGPIGPATELNGLMLRLKMLFDKYASEASAATANFQTAMDYLAQAETDAHGQIQAVAQALALAASTFQDTATGEFDNFEAQQKQQKKDLKSLIDVTRLLMGS